MRMGINKCREDGGSRLAARGRLLAARGRLLADTDDAAVVDLDPPVPDWGRVDGQNPCGAMDAGHLVDCIR